MKTLSRQGQVMKFYTERAMQTEQTQQQKPEEQEQEKEGRTPPDPELHAMKRCLAILRELPPSARVRCLAYVSHRIDEERYAAAQVPLGESFSEYVQRERRLGTPGSPVLGALAGSEPR